MSISVRKLQRDPSGFVCWEAINRVPHWCKKLCSPGVDFKIKEVQVAFEFCQASSKS